MGKHKKVLASLVAAATVATGAVAMAAPAQAGSGYYMPDKNPWANAGVYVRGRALSNPSCSVMIDGRWFHSRCRTTKVWVTPSGVVYRANVYIPAIRSNVLIYK